MYIEQGRDFSRAVPYLKKVRVQAACCHGHSETSNVFRSEGEYWTVTFAEKTCRIRDTLGMHYLAQLLRAPQQEIPVLTLAAENTDHTLSDNLVTQAMRNSRHRPDGNHILHAGLGDAGELFDTQAKAAYKQRLQELHSELEEAQAFNNIGHVDKIRQEIDFLTTEITRAVGLGGRIRKAASPVERARVNVTLAIKTALKRITTHHPPLGHYLTRTIKTGYACVYTPEPTLVMEWQF